MAFSFERMSKEDLVYLFRTVGGQDVTLEVINRDIEIGAPVNDDGTINLFDYAAWLYDAGYLRAKGYYAMREKLKHGNQEIPDD